MHQLWVAGAIAKTEEGEKLEELGVNVLSGIKKMVEILKEAIARDLELPE
jgi:CRISPR-associated protein Cst2